jgi:hypothetical protein
MHTIKATMVEDFLQTFEAQSSNSHTRFSLARVNGIAAYEAWRQTGSPVLFAYPTSMRSYFQIQRGSVKSDGGSRMTSRARAKLAVKDFVSSVYPTDLAGQLTSLRSDDEDDAILAAMYCLAQEVEWQVLQEGGSFAVLLDEKLPSARLGKVGAKGSGVSRESLRHALQELHRTALGVELGKRVLSEGYSGDTGSLISDSWKAQGGVEDRVQGKKPRKKRGVTLEVTELQAGRDAKAAETLDPAHLQSLYKRLRLALTGQVKVAIKRVLLWEANQKAAV